MAQKLMHGLIGEDLVVDRTGLRHIYDRLRENDYTVYGTVNEKGTGLFRHLDEYSDFVPRCTGGTLPPKHIWYPPYETMFIFNRKTGEFKEVERHPVKQAVFGIRPCDVHALLALDEVFLGGDFVDPCYWSRRAELFLVVFNCVEAGDTCFCSSMGTGPGLDHDYDLLVTQLRSVDRDGFDEFLLEVGSRAGGYLVQGLQGREAERVDYEQKRRLLEDAAGKTRIALNTDGLPHLMQEGYSHPYWEEVASKCFGCANCTTVCPTCYCADIFDETDYHLRETRRKRRWSWCFLVEFAAVHGGNYREKRIDRLRQFMQHKLNFSVGQYGFFHCVGCGRCIVWCPANIDIAQTGRVIRGDA